MVTMTGSRNGFYTSGQRVVFASITPFCNQREQKASVLEDFCPTTTPLAIKLIVVRIAVF